MHPSALYTKDYGTIYWWGRRRTCTLRLSILKTTDNILVGQAEDVHPSALYTKDYRDNILVGQAEDVHPSALYTKDYGTIYWWGRRRTCTLRLSILKTTGQYIGGAGGGRAPFGSLY